MELLHPPISNLQKTMFLKQPNGRMVAATNKGMTLLCPLAP